MSEQLNNGKAANYKRSLKRLWLNPKYQARYIFWITLTGLVLVILQSAVFYFFVKENYSILVDLGPTTDEVKAQLYHELHQMQMALLAGGVVFTSVIAFLGLIFSHRTVGPLYHFKRVFDDIKEGNISARIRLRPRDDFKEVASAFNHMMDELKKRGKL
jgi:methyl-accepting chemotaxis protein